jgi:hypothetical protein
MLSVLRIEWCKARARAHRWQEECLLLKEEMRRVIQFFDSEVLRWNRLAEQHIDENMPELQEGRQAYGYRQASMWVAMREHCQKTWCAVPQVVELIGDYKDKKSGLVEIEYKQ